MVGTGEGGSAIGRLGPAFRAAVTAEGLDPPPRLRLVAAAGVEEPGRSPAIGLDGPGSLGTAYESLLGTGTRRRRGIFYTPAAVAGELVERALPELPPAGAIVDPTCGGGGFLLAAADRLVALGLSPRDALARLWGADVDPGAVAVAEASLWWWAARQGSTRWDGVDLQVGDTLVEVDLPPAAAVVGNPPFLGQLRSETSMSPAMRRAVQVRYGALVRPYTDPSWLFLVAAVRCLVAGGRAVLLQPQSLLGARDAAPVRTAVATEAVLSEVWEPASSVFGADVDVCAPVLWRGTAPESVGDAPTPQSPAWAAVLAERRGVPSVPAMGTSPTIGDLAHVHAGFRGEYYGLVPAVVEGGDGLRLVTVGAIDPLRLRPVGQRFAGRRWVDPRVDPRALDGRVARWVEVQARPKILVATQTRVLEAVADPEGVLVGSVPVIAVVPHDPGDVWLLLAALGAPVTSARLLRQSTGTGLSVDACRPTAALVAGLPVPENATRWSAASDAARAVSDRAEPLGPAALRRFGELADHAFGVDDPAPVEWWWSRLPRRVR